MGFDLMAPPSLLLPLGSASNGGKVVGEGKGHNWPVAMYVGKEQQRWDYFFKMLKFER